MKLQLSALSLVIGLAACGGDNPPANTANATPSATTAPTETAPPATATAEVKPEEHKPVETKPEEHPAEPPPAPKTVADLIGSSGASKFEHALKEAGLLDELKNEGPWTVFAPTDEAFDKKWPEKKLEKLLKEKDMKGLKAALNAHIVKGHKIAKTEIDPKKGFSQKNENGKAVKLTTKKAKDGTETVLVGAAKVKDEHDVSNGAIYIIEAALP